MGMVIYIIMQSENIYVCSREKCRAKQGKALEAAFHLSTEAIAGAILFIRLLYFMQKNKEKRKKEKREENEKEKKRNRKVFFFTIK